MRVLLIGEHERLAIAAAVTAARANVLPWEKLQGHAIANDAHTFTLEDRKAGADELCPPRSQHIMIPNGYHAAISFEDQPVGLVRHVSISVEGGELGAMPSEQAVIMIGKAFGIEKPCRMWIEEFSPGEFAINLVQLDEEREAPTDTKQ